MEWVNPHTWIHLEVTNDDGTREVWMVEGGTPNTLLRRGLRRDYVQPGTVVVVDGYQSKDRTARANARDLTFEDGRKFFMGSSGTGGPVRQRAAPAVGELPDRSAVVWTREIEAAMRNEFTAVLERDGAWYIAYSPEIPGANGQGRTREEARRKPR